MGRKWILQMLSLHRQGFLILAAAFCPPSKSVERGCAPSFSAHAGLRGRVPLSLLRIQDQVHVVWHQAISPHFHVRLARLLAKQIAVNLLIAIFKEYRLSSTTTLGHVVRETGFTMRAKRVMSADLQRTKTEGNRYHVGAPSKLACSSRCKSGPGKV
jgi:hypothetical protein